MKFDLISTATRYHPEDAERLKPYGFTFGEPDKFGRVEKLTSGYAEVNTLEELIALHHAIDCEIILSSNDLTEPGEERVYWLEVYDDHHD